MVNKLMTFFLVLISVFTSSFLYAGLFNQDTPLEADKAFIITSTKQQNNLIINIEISPKYYLYKDKFILKNQNNKILKLDYPNNFISKDDPAFGKVDVYKNSVSFVVNTANISSKKINFIYQGCWEGGICYPIQTYEIALGNTDKPNQEMQQSISQVSVNEDSNSNSGFSLISNGSLNEIVDFIHNSNAFFVLLIFLLIGILLAFTPCVLPMVPIIYSIILNQKTTPSPTQSGILVSIYVLGMVIAFSAVGVVVAMIGANLQAAMQHPVFIWGFALFLVYLSGAMFGWYRLEAPAFIQRKFSGGNSKSSGYLGVFIFGAVSVLIVGPCVTPPLVAILLFISQTGDLYFGALSLAALSFGMGIPLIIAATMTTKSLPKAGGWMEVVKALFGFSLLSLAVYMLTRVVDDELGNALVSFLCVSFAVSIWHKRLDIKSFTWRVIADTLAIFMMFIAVSIFFNLQVNKQQSNINKVSIQPNLNLKGKSYNMAELEEAIEKSNLPAVVYFTADWCISCTRLKSGLFAEQSVKNNLSEFNFIVVDVTDNNAKDKEIQEFYGIVGPPTFLFFDKHGQDIEGFMLVGEIKENEFIAKLNQVKTFNK